MTESAEPAVKPLGLFARIVGMITAPRATYENVVKAPQPFGILFVSALVIGIAQTVLQMDPRIQQASVEMQIQGYERFSGKAATPQVREQVEQRSKATVYLTPIGPLIALPIFCLLATAIYWVVFNAVLGGTASFKQVLAVVTHSQVFGAIGIVAGAPIQYSQGTLTPGGPFNLGALVPMLPDSSVLKTLLSWTSVFTVWSIIVSAIGLAVLYRRKTLNIAIVLFIVYGLIMGGVASIFSRFTGGR
jgi:hypothetical protein